MNYEQYVNLQRIEKNKTRVQNNSTDLTILQNFFSLRVVSPKFFKILYQMLWTFFSIS